jgi:hypothetical protein
VDDVQRYRLNAAECLSAAERCELPYRRLTLAIAEAWLSLARQQEAMDELLAIWTISEASTTAATARVGGCGLRVGVGVRKQGKKRARGDET